MPWKVSHVDRDAVNNSIVVDLIYSVGKMGCI